MTPRPTPTPAVDAATERRYLLDALRVVVFANHGDWDAAQPQLQVLADATSTDDVTDGLVRLVAEMLATFGPMDTHCTDCFQMKLTEHAPIADDEICAVDELFAAAATRAFGVTRDWALSDHLDDYAGLRAAFAIACYTAENAGSAVDPNGSLIADASPAPNREQRRAAARSQRRPVNRGGNRSRKRR